MQDTQDYLAKKGQTETSIHQTIFWSLGNLPEALVEAKTEEASEVMFPLVQAWWRGCWTKRMDKIIDVMQAFDAWRETKRIRFLRFNVQLVHNILRILWKKPMEQPPEAMLSVKEQEAMRFIKSFSETVNEEVLEGMYHLFNTTRQYVEQQAEARMVFINASWELIHAF